MCCYSSRTGCVLYFDDVKYDRCLCEPTMLFLLGMDAVLTPGSDYVLVNENDEEIVNEDALRYLTIKQDAVGELYDSIIQYLSLRYSIISSTENSATFDIQGMKLFMNEVTGTDTDRIVPIIFHEHDHKYEYEGALGEIDKEDKYNDLASKIKNVFNYAGYDVADAAVPVMGKSFITDQDIIDAIDEYNKNLLEEHKKKAFYRHVYKILDYKSMYSYALGVLYGCICLGYPENFIWRQDPENWYDGEYSNLVSTAYTTFRFHYTHPIPKIDIDINLSIKYRGIQLNYLWNFDNDLVQLKNDEKNCIVAYINDEGEVETEDIAYSRSTGPQKPLPGSYLRLDDNTWTPLDESVVCDDPKKGIIHKCDPTIIRYIANDEVVFQKAYKYGKAKFLSPNSDDIYFCYTGNLGWVDFDERSFATAPSSEFVPLTIMAKSFSCLPQDRFGNVVSRDTGEVVGYYMTDVTPNIHLYGIMSGKIDMVANTGSYVTEPLGIVIEEHGSYVTEPLDIIVDSNGDDITGCDCACCKSHCNNHSSCGCNCCCRHCDDCNRDIIYGKPCYYRDDLEEDSSEDTDEEDDVTNDDSDENTDTEEDPVITYLWDFNNVDNAFVYILNENDFIARYTVIPDGYTATTYYDLDRKITIYVSNIDNNYYFDGTGDALITDSGYSLTTSEPISAYTYDVENNCLVSFDLRYDKYTSLYWSREWEPRKWDPSFGDGVFIDTGSVTSVYRNTELLIEDAIILHDSIGESDLVCNTSCTEYGLSLGILHLSDLYSQGITRYECEIIEADPNGDPLIDEYGNFVVWHDSITNKYWNGYANVWQDSVPIRNNTVMYDTSTHTALGISDNEVDHEIVLHDGTVVTYDEFYAYPYNRGVIRDSTSFKLFNPDVSSNILQCYYDDKFEDHGRYCVPDVFEHWMTFDEVHANNYRFVNNESILYDGDSLVPVIVDNDSDD